MTKQVIELVLKKGSSEKLHFVSLGEVTTIDERRSLVPRGTKIRSVSPGFGEVPNVWAVLPLTPSTEDFEGIGNFNFEHYRNHIINIDRWAYSYITNIHLNTQYKDRIFPSRFL